MSGSLEAVKREGSELDTFASLKLSGLIASQPFVLLAMSSIPHRLQNLCGDAFAIQPMISEHFRRGTAGRVFG
jgi:hypothetical protein